VDIGYGLSVFAGYGRSVSGSNTIPVNWLTNLSPDLTFNGKENGSLHPEKSTKVECGLKYRKRGLVFASDIFDFTATFFRTRIEDVIVAGSGGSGMKPISDIINDDDDLETEGFELIAEWGSGPFDAS
jgi:hemoglobin/transferrin/lactoferrin receptor protein